MGLTGPFHLIQSMYMAPAARLVVADLLSEKFRLFKGTRQGYPLSPLLFNLALEPLSRILNYDASLHGIHLGEHELRFQISDYTTLLVYQG